MIQRERLLQLFAKIRRELLASHHEWAGIETRKGTDSSSPSDVLKADLWAERMLVPGMYETWELPVLCEESENSGLLGSVPGITLLPYTDDVTDLPPNCISIDGLDGSALYANGVFDNVSVSVAVIKNGQPKIGIVMTLGSGNVYHTGLVDENFTASVEKWEFPYLPLQQSLIGTDGNKAVDPDFHNQVISKLMCSQETRYPLNVPSAAGGIMVLRRQLAAYVTSNARNWDLAGVAALCRAKGTIIRCLDGSQVPWNKVRLPPVVIARDEEAFTHVWRTANDYLLSR